MHAVLLTAVLASGSCSGGRGRVGTCWPWETTATYVDVCTAARGASAPTGEMGGGISYVAAACLYSLLTWSAAYCNEAGLDRPCVRLSFVKFYIIPVWQLCTKVCSLCNPTVMRPTTSRLSNFLQSYSTNSFMILRAPGHEDSNCHYS